MFTLEVEIIKQDDDYMFDEIFDEVLSNCIEGMSQLGSQITQIDTDEGSVEKGSGLSDDFPIMTDGHEKGEFSDPCENLWQEAGEYVQRAFEKKLPQSPSNSVSERYSLSPHPIHTEFSKENKEPMQPTKYYFQSPSLAEWVRDNVEIVYDD